jgi:hypothetical protein
MPAGTGFHFSGSRLEADPDRSLKNQASQSFRKMKPMLDRVYEPPDPLFRIPL